LFNPNWIVDFDHSLQCCHRKANWYVFTLLLQSLVFLIFFFFGSVGTVRFAQQKATDARVKFVKELVSAMRIVKYYAWEVPFRQNINKARELELKSVAQSIWVRAQLLVVLINVPTLGIGLTFTFYGIANTLDVSSVFTSVALLNLLRGPFILFPLLISFGMQYAYVYHHTLLFAC